MGHDDGKRGEILTAAGTVFGEYGFRKTTVGDIIRAAGVSRATVYKYFDDKADIFDAVMEREIRQLLAADREAVVAETTTRGRLRAVMMTHTEGIRQNANILRLLREAFVEIIPRKLERIEGLTQEGAALIRGILEQGVEDGEIVVEDIDRATIILIYAVKGIFVSAATDVWDEKREVVVDGLLDMVMNGLRPRDGA